MNNRFSRNNFIRIIREIEYMESKGENIWVPIGILEYMYQDDDMEIDSYFHCPKDKRDLDLLMNCLLF
jgi:hypothetical protein